MVRLKYPLVAGYSLIVLRGSLLSAIGPLVVMLALGWIVTCRAGPSGLPDLSLVEPPLVRPAPQRAQSDAPAGTMAVFRAAGHPAHTSPPELPLPSRRVSG